MAAARWRWGLASAALAAFFAAVVCGILSLLPHPLSRADYFVAGSVATLLVLLALFVALVAASLRPGKRWLRRRP